MSDKPETFSEFYKLDKQQAELDFVDVPVDGSDIQLFIDPYAMTKRQDEWYVECAHAVYNYFDHLLELIRADKKSAAIQLLSGLHESNETKLGYSPKNHGSAIGREQSLKLYESLRQSRAVETGILKDIEECNLMIPGIDRDKISDITTNVIKRYLIEYTQAQCKLHGVPLISRPVKHVFDTRTYEWSSEYHELPIDSAGNPIILVPKVLVRIIPVLHAQEFYQHYVLNYLQQELHSAGSSLCRVLKNGNLKKPAKKTLTQEYTRVGDPTADGTRKSLKEYLYGFTLQNPHILQEYEDTKKNSDEPLSNDLIEKNNKKRPQNYDKMVERLKQIPEGKTHAYEYHSHIIGVLTAIFSPLLTSPSKETPINEETKRIDITFVNSARHGFFSSLRPLKGIAAAYIFTECKNYTKDAKNPEVDQLGMRFSKRRGQFGFLVVRNLKDRKKLIQRCRAVAKDGHGWVVVLTDADIIRLLELKSNNRNREINDFMEQRLQEVID
ncbi:MAG TPA: hypothetical protein VLF62_04265 [Candidatus Saccharimonadales bacterium]|nr:hypothetical protein [Candidatus Saccharimonadales bacterium]